MPTYTITLPVGANNSYSGDASNYNLINTGITLESDEYPSSIVTSNFYLHVKNIFSDELTEKTLEIFICDSENQYATESVSYGYTAFTINSGQSYTSTTAKGGQWSLSNPTRLKGKNLSVYFMFLGNSSLLTPKDRLEILDPITFTLVTRYPSVHITTSSTTGGTVTSIDGDYIPYDTLNLSATASSSSYEFDRWESDGGSFSDVYASSTVFTIPRANANITGRFKAKSTAPATAGRYNGSSWGKVILLRYNGSSWVECELKRYNGSSWTNVDTQ